jgi:hypothetical protein
MKYRHNAALLLLFVLMSFSILAQNSKPGNTAVIINNQTVNSGTTNNSTQANLNITGTSTGTHDIRQTSNAVNSGLGGSTIGSSNTHSSGTNNSGTTTNTTPVTCPMMYVNVEIPFLQSCVSSVANISYCNQGNHHAYNAYVDLELDTALTLDSASVAYTPLTANTYRFNLGNILAGNCGNLQVFFTTACDNALLLDEHCIAAHIYPDTLCSTVWNSPLITVDGTISGNNISFLIGNKGTSITPLTPIHCIIIDDHLLAQSGGSIVLYQGLLTLGANDRTTLNILSIASNHRYKLEIRDSLGALIASSTISNYVTNPTVYDYHAQEFWNGSRLPSEDLGCAINGNVVQQANISQNPSNNGSNTSNTVEESSPHGAENLDESSIVVQALPNPFETYTMIKIEGQIAANYSFKLYDLTGKIVQMQYLVEQQEFIVERGNLLSGMYIYQIEAEGKLLAAGKIVVR